MLRFNFWKRPESSNLIQIIIFSIASIVSLVLFITVEKKTPFPLIDFKLLKNRIILSANIINMTVGLTALMVVYQTLPILIRSPPPAGFGGDASSIAIVQLPYMIVSLIFSVASGFIVSKFGNLRPTYIGNDRYYYRLFCPFHVSFNGGFYSCGSCHCSYWVSINANRFCECCSDFDPKAIQWNIIGNESSNLPYWILGGTCHCRHIYASKPGICRTRNRQYFSLIPISRVI